MARYKLSTKPVSNQLLCQLSAVKMYIDKSYIQTVKKLHLKAGFNIQSELKLADKPLIVSTQLNECM